LARRSRLVNVSGSGSSSEPDFARLTVRGAWPDPAAMSAEFVYRILTQQAWTAALERGVFTGSEHDVRDGFIHFSTAAQVAETAAKHYAAQPGLVLLWVRVDALGSALRWEPSRGGALFPHLYAGLRPSSVARVDALPLDARGQHVLPTNLE
jgi:uncharacterized protein (DUF952 family)